MRIAYASCMYLEDQTTQPVWQEIQAQKPDVLILLGDNIYTGYGIRDATQRPQRALSGAAFIEKFGPSYEQQLKVPAFNKLLRWMKENNKKVIAVWDDHDFGYNNGFGQDAGFQGIFGSTALFLEFQRVLAEPDTAYQLNMQPAETHPKRLNGGLGVGTRLEYQQGTEKVLLHILDTRSARGDVHLPHQSLLTDRQRTSLAKDMADYEGLIVIGSGAPFSVEGIISGQSWLHFTEHAWFADLARQRLMRNRPFLILCGDIHRNKFVCNNRIVELYSSAAAKGSKQNYGLLDIDAAKVQAQFFDRRGLQASYRLDRTHWGQYQATHPFPNTEESEPEPQQYPPGWMITTRGGTPAAGFDKTERAAPAYFACEVSSPNRRDAANWFEMSTADDWDNLRQRLADVPDAGAGRRLVLFVHGFRKDWEDSVQNYNPVYDSYFAQPGMAQGDRIAGFPVLFAWPTRDEGNRDENYRADRHAAEANAAQLAAVLQAHHEKFSGDWRELNVRLCVIANSMGNYLMQKALALIPSVAAHPVVDVFLMCAADVDNNLFDADNQDGAAIARNCRLVRVLFTNRDNAALPYAARHFHEDRPRLGYRGPAGPVPKNVWACDSGALLKYGSGDAHHALYQDHPGLLYAIPGWINDQQDAEPVFKRARKVARTPDLVD